LFSSGFFSPSFVAGTRAVEKEEEEVAGLSPPKENPPVEGAAVVAVDLLSPKPIAGSLLACCTSGFLSKLNPPKEAVEAAAGAAVVVVDGVAEKPNPPPVEEGAAAPKENPPPAGAAGGAVKEEEEDSGALGAAREKEGRLEAPEEGKLKETLAGDPKESEN
jgi:hypothetical protein